MKKTLSLALALLIPLAASADNVGQCGWGSKLFDGKSGMASQVLAVTTNGTLGNQTFGISSGTSGCTRDGVVRSGWKTAAYVDGNMNKLARDMSQGRGESLDTLASLLNVSDSDRPLFSSVLQQNFSRIFASQDASSVEVTAALRDTLSANSRLAQYAANV